MEERLGRLERRVDGHGDRLNALEVREAATMARQEAMQQDLSDIKGNTQWIIRLIVGAVVMALIGLAVARGGA